MVKIFRGHLYWQTQAIGHHWTSWEAPPTQTMNLRSLNARTTRLSGLSAMSFHLHFISSCICFCYYMIFKLLLSVILFYSTYYFNTGLENTFWFSFIFLTCWMSVNLFIHQLSLRSAKEAGLWLSLTLVASLKVSLLQIHIPVICTCSFFVLLHFYLWHICSFSVMFRSHCGADSFCSTAIPWVQNTSLTVANVKVSFKADFYYLLFDWIKCA